MREQDTNVRKVKQILYELRASHYRKRRANNLERKARREFIYSVAAAVRRSENRIFRAQRNIFTQTSLPEEKKFSDIYKHILKVKFARYRS